MAADVLTITVGWISLSLLCGVAWVTLLLLIDFFRPRGSGPAQNRPVHAPSAAPATRELDPSSPQAAPAERRSPDVQSSKQASLEQTVDVGEDIAA